MAQRYFIFLFFVSTALSQSWRRVFKLNRDVDIPKGPNEIFFDDSIVTYPNIAAEDAWLASAEGQSLNWQSYNFKSRVINDWKSNNLAVTKVRLSFTLGGAVQKSIQFSTSSPNEIFNRGSWFVKEKVEYSSWSDLPSSRVWNTAAWYGINTGSWSNQRTFTVFDPQHGPCNDQFYFLVTVANWCTWESASLANPKIMYSDLPNTKQSGYDAVQNADSMIIEIYYSVPTTDPTPAPTSDPTNAPTQIPSRFPTNDPTQNPTNNPSIEPTVYPTQDPTAEPTFQPTADPTIEPTAMPSFYPTVDPTSDPTLKPSENPTSPLIQCEDDDNAVLKVSFDYTLSDDSTSENAVISNLTEAAGIFIDSEFDDLTSCEVSDYSVDVKLISESKAHVNASICFSCTEGTDLNIDIDSNELEKDFKKTVDGATPILVVNTVNDITLVAHDEGQVHDTDTTTTDVIVENTSDESPSLISGIDDMLLISVLTVIVSMLALIVCFLFVVYVVRKRKAAKSKEQKPIYNGHTELAKVVSISDFPNERESIDIEQHSVEMDGLIVTGSVALTPVDNGLNTPNGMLLMDLSHWLNNIGLIQYYDIFVENGFGEDISKFRSLDDETLKQMGIKKMAHRKRILLDQINTEDFNFGEDKSQLNVVDDELYRKPLHKNEHGDEHETPVGATPSDPNKKSQHIVVPSDMGIMTLNGVNQNVTDQGLGDIPDEEDEGSGQEEESNDKMDDLLYQKPQSNNNESPTQQ